MLLTRNRRAASRRRTVSTPGPQWAASAVFLPLALAGLLLGAAACTSNPVVAGRAGGPVGTTATPTTPAIVSPGGTPAEAMSAPLLGSTPSLSVTPTAAAPSAPSTTADPHRRRHRERRNLRRLLDPGFRDTAVLTAAGGARSGRASAWPASVPAAIP